MSIPTMVSLSQFFSLTPWPLAGVDVVPSKSQSPYGKGMPVQAVGGPFPGSTLAWH